MSPALAVSRRGLLKGAAAFAAASALPLRAQTVHNIMYVGCYTARGRGVYVFQQDPSTGKLTELSVATDVQPSFVALDPQARFLYACNEIANYAGGVTGSVTSFAVDANTGNLTLLNKQSSEGRNPAHVSVEPTGKFALAANYSGGSVTVLPILEDGRLGPPTHNVLHTGRLGPNTGRQEAPHAHQILSDPFGRYVLANDLALDQTIVYFLDRNSGTLIPNSIATAAPGAGPRHLAFFPDGRFVFVLNELDNTV
ncbi:MAG: lactonase family protein, partial [Bryobacteraceae bacterium]